MAESRYEEEERERRDLRSRSQTTDHPERIKPEHLHSSQGPLSSIRAAIKRTRTNSQCDQTRERRRPEITIVSAEPLASNNWFPGPTVVYPSPLPSDWSAGIRGLSQPPPSYDQVIQQKTQEECIVKPIAAPRRITSATQTDLVRDNTSNAAPQAAEKRPPGITPKKPPRPSLPKPPEREPASESVACTDEKVQNNPIVTTSAEDVSQSDINPSNPADFPLTCTRSVTVHWDIPTEHLTTTAAETSSSSAHAEHCQLPIPRPRTKNRKQAITEEVNVQTLVIVNSEHIDHVHSDPERVPSNKYLEDLLDVFSADYECVESGDIFNQSDDSLEEDNYSNMNPEHNHRNIQARIMAFEHKTDSIEGNEPVKQELPHSRATSKPPVAAKPSVTLKFNHSINDNQNVIFTNIPSRPILALKPLPPRNGFGQSVKMEQETLPSTVATPNRSRPSVLTRVNCICEDEDSPVPPTPPRKPFKEPLRTNLNIINHNSASVVRENVYVDSPSNPLVVKPPHYDASVPRPSVTKRPTTIKVPSKSGSLSGNFQDSPPPLPPQKPVGNLNTSMNHRQSLTPILPVQVLSPTVPEPSLPPRNSSRNKTLPPRPPPAKTGAGRPPPPSIQAKSQSFSTVLEASLKPKTQKPQRKGPVLPPRPNPGHRLYNKYTLQLSHGIATMDYNGSNSGELSFQKNEVLLLLEEIDHSTFDCQVGDTRGRVQKSRMKVITPLDSMANTSSAQDTVSNAAENGLTVQVMHDFVPEGPGELALRAGDVVSAVAVVDGEWYRGTCKGSTGFFPVSYVKTMSHSPKSLPERKAKPPLPAAEVSGPRCVARFDFEGEHSDELSFFEGDVIQLKAFVGQDWARGQLRACTGIFPLNFVEIVEDLPPTQTQQTQTARVALPGTSASQSTQPEVAEPSQESESRVEWVVALYDFSGKSEGDLSFQQGDRILIRRHIDAEWSYGWLSGREGMLPRAFVESCSASGRARALYNFTSNCEEELSLKVGDIITGLESIDEEWFLGDLRGKRALVPKNYVQVLEQ